MEEGDCGRIEAGPHRDDLFFYTGRPNDGGMRLYREMDDIIGDE